MKNAIYLCSLRWLLIGPWLTQPPLCLSVCISPFLLLSLPYSVSVYVILHTFLCEVWVGDQPQVLVLTFQLVLINLLLSAVYSRLTGPWSPKESPVFASHLPVASLGLQTLHTLIFMYSKCFHPLSQLPRFFLKALGKNAHTCSTPA